MRKRLLVLLVAAAALPADARPFKDFCEQFEPLRKLTDLKYIKPRVRVQPKDPVKVEDVVFTIEARSGAIRVVPAADGSIDFPFSDKLCEENPNIESNQPKGSMALNISIDPAIPPVRTLDYRLLESLRKEWDTAISRQSLMWRVLAPSAKAYEIVFAPGTAASAEIRLAQGPRRIAADEKGVIRIPFEDAWVNANPTIVLSDTPKKIGLAFKS